MMHVLMAIDRMRDQRGATTVEWLGLATIAILVIALLLPQVRSTAGDIWGNVSGQFTGFFG
jgi:Flp pilus assembly pilin Flp